MQYKLTINQKIHLVEVESNTPLLWVLRDSLNLLGTKFGCGSGQCGACTVLLDDKPVRSCIVLVSNLERQKITTIEGVGDKNNLHIVQQVWKDLSVPQCGYCQSGQILTAINLLEKNSNPNDEDIDKAMTNICRCGAYPEIRQAIHLASEKIK